MCGSVWVSILMRLLLYYAPCEAEWLLRDVDLALLGPYGFGNHPQALSMTDYHRVSTNTYTCIHESWLVDLLGPVAIKHEVSVLSAVERINLHSPLVGYDQRLLNLCGLRFFPACAQPEVLNTFNDLSTNINCFRNVGYGPRLFPANLAKIVVCAPQLQPCNDQNSCINSRNHCSLRRCQCLGATTRVMPQPWHWYLRKGLVLNWVVICRQGQMLN